MLIKAERLSDVALRRFANQDVEAGRREIDAIARKCLRWLRGITLARIAIGTMSGMVFVCSLLTIPRFGGSALTCVFLAFPVLLSSVLMGEWVQTRARFFAEHPYAVKLPNALERLLDELASGRLQAWQEAKYGLVGPSAMRTTEGKLLDELISPNVFANRFAPILFSSEWRRFDDLWMPRGQALTRSIYIIGDSEITVNPERDGEHHWIARIPTDSFPGWVDFIIRRGGWDGPAEVQMRLVLQTAYDFARALADAGKVVEVAKMVEQCSKALADQGFATEPPIGTKGKAPVAAESLRKLLGDGQKLPYKFVRESAKALTRGDVWGDK